MTNSPIQRVLSEVLGGLSEPLQPVGPIRVAPDSFSREKNPKSLDFYFSSLVLVSVRMVVEKWFELLEVRCSAFEVLEVTSWFNIGPD